MHNRPNRDLLHRMGSQLSALHTDKCQVFCDTFPDFCAMDTLRYSNQRVMNVERKLIVKLKQRICIEFCVKPDESNRDIVNMVNTAFGAQALSARSISRWALFFRRNNSHITDQPRTGHPRSRRTAANVQTVQAELQRDRTLNVRQIAANVGLSKDTVHRIIRKNLQLRKRVAKFIPHVLNAAQRRDRVQTCGHWLRHFGHLRDRIVTVDETYVHCYDPKTCQSSMEWLAPGQNQPQKPLRERTVCKQLLTVFWDSNGVIFRHFLPPNVNMNAGHYVRILRLFRHVLARRRPQLFHCNRVILHQDNASLHRARITQNFLRRNNMATLPHPLIPQT